MTKETTAMSKNKSADFLKVTQIKSQIGTKPLHRGTLNALGLRRIGRSNYFVNSKEINGMIARVAHLVSVEHIGEDQLPKNDDKKAAKLLAALTKAGGSKK